MTKPDGEGLMDPGGLTRTEVYKYIAPAPVPDPRTWSAHLLQG